MRKTTPIQKLVRDRMDAFKKGKQPPAIPQDNNSPTVDCYGGAVTESMLATLSMDLSARRARKALETITACRRKGKPAPESSSDGSDENSAVRTEYKSEARTITPNSPLTALEIEVAILTAMGLYDAEIATALGVSLQVAKARLYAMGNKFGGFNGVVVTHWAIQQGIVMPGDLATLNRKENTDPRWNESFFGGFAPDELSNAMKDRIDALILDVVKDYQRRIVQIERMRRPL